MPLERLLDRLITDRLQQVELSGNIGRKIVDPRPVNDEQTRTAHTIETVYQP